MDKETLRNINAEAFSVLDIGRRILSKMQEDKSFADYELPNLKYHIKNLNNIVRNSEEK